MNNTDDFQPTSGDERIASLGFVQHPVHRAVLEDILAETQDDPEVVGVLLAGSVARRDAFPGSDLDLRVLLADGSESDFVSETRHGVSVEMNYRDFAGFAAKLEQNPMEVYAYLDGRVLLDRRDEWRLLRVLAQTRFENYRAGLETRRSMAYWLNASRIKLAAAWEAGDLLRASYIATTSTWKLLEGLWALNNRPMPPAGAMWAHLSDLRLAPDNLETLLEQVFVGGTLERLVAMLSLLDWVLVRLEAEGAISREP